MNAGDAAHWARGIRQPVQFAPAINAIADFGVDIWLELGAHPALAHSIAECLASRGGSKPIVISSVRREREHDSLLEAAMDLHRAGVALDFKADDAIASFASASGICLGSQPLVERSS